MYVCFQVGYVTLKYVLWH